MNVSLQSDTLAAARRAYANPLQGAWDKLRNWCLTDAAHLPLVPSPEDAEAVIGDIEFARRAIWNFILDYEMECASKLGCDADYFRQARDLIDDGFSQLGGHLIDVMEQMREDEREEA